MNTARFLELLSLGILAIIEWISDKQMEEPEKQTEKPEKEYYLYIAGSLPVLYCIYLLVDSKCFGNGLILSVLQWIQNHFVIMCIYIIVAAVLPSAVAWIEQKKGKFEAEKSYALAYIYMEMCNIM